MPRATYVAVLTIGIFYTVTTYLMVEGQGAAGLQEYLGSLQPDPTAFLFALGATYIGPALTTVMSLLFISSVFAALLAFHNAVARYLYALGREGLVPARLGRTHPKHLSPHVGSLSQSILAVVVVLIFVITQQDPVLALFTWLTQLGTLAIIVLMALASFAVVAFFARNRDLDSERLADYRRTAGWRSGDVGGRYLRGLPVRLADRQSRKSAALDPARLDHRCSGSRGYCRNQPEGPITGVVRADGPASRHRVGGLTPTLTTMPGSRLSRFRGCPENASPTASIPPVEGLWAPSAMQNQGERDHRGQWSVGRWSTCSL